MNQYYWSFAEKGDSHRGTQGEDASLKFFRKFPNRCLIREFAQNSLDAPSNAPTKPTVEIHVSYMNLDDDIKKQMVDGVYEHMKACQKAGTRTGNSKNAFDEKVRYIESCRGKKVTCLKISDFNTTGMDYEDENLLTTEEEFYNHKQLPFNSCVLSNGASNKSSGRAAGSHGQGKNVGLVKSKIDAVYYSTMTEPYDEKGNSCESKCFGEGVIQLCEHRIFSGDEKGVYLKDGFFGSRPGYHPDEGDEIPNCFKRTFPGTDVYIIGVEKSEDDEKEIKQYMLRSFFASIKLRGIKFNLFGEEFYAGNLEEKMNKYFPEEEFSDYDKVFKNYRVNFNPRPFCLKALCETRDDESFLVREATQANYPNLGAATLYIWKDETIKLNSKNKDTILCARDNGMIIEVRRLKSAKGLYGVLICEGEGSKYLRFMENVTHDEWSTAELEDTSPENALIAKAAYSEIGTFIDDVISELFPYKEGDELSVPGLDKIMGSLGNDRASNYGESTEGFEKEDDYGLLSFSTTTEGLKSKSHSGEKEGKLVSRKRGGINKRIKKQLAGQKLPKTKQTNNENDDDENKNNNNKNRKLGEKTRTPDNSGTLMQEGAVDENKRGMHSEVIPALFLQKSIHSDYGIIHRIRIKALEDYDYCSMVINVADMGIGAPISVKAISRSKFDRNPDIEYDDQFIIEGLYGNSIRGFQLYKGFNYFDVKFNDEDDHSLMITAYENK